MKRLILSSWFVLPALLLAYHYGPGQKQSALDEVALMTQAAHHYSEDAQWEKAIDLYDQSLQSMPEGEEAISRRIRLEKAKAQMMASQLPEARESLVALMDEVSGDEQSEAALGDEVRQSLANAEFYLTWLMRLEAWMRLPGGGMPSRLGSIMVSGDPANNPRQGIHKSSTSEGSDGHSACENGPGGPAGTPPSQPVTGLW